MARGIRAIHPGGAAHRIDPLLSRLILSFLAADGGFVLRMSLIIVPAAAAPGYSSFEWCSRNSRRRILPDALRGRAATNSTYLGVL